MKLGIFCDETLRLLSNFEYAKSELNFERRDVRANLSEAIGMALTANFWDNQKSEWNRGNFDAGFLTTFESVPVVFSTSRKKWYCVLPSIPVALEGGLGLYEITPMEDQSTAFVPMKAGSAGLFKGLAAENLFGEPGFRQEGIRAWFANYNFASIKNPAVLINMVADVSELSLDAELMVPSNYLAQVRGYVIQLLTQGIQSPVDSAIDQTPSNKIVK